MLATQIQIRAAVMRLPLRVVDELRIGPRLRVMLCVVADGFAGSGSGARRPLWRLRDQVEDLVGYGYADVWWVCPRRAKQLGIRGDVIGIALRTSSRVMAALGHQIRGNEWRAGESC